ncbi:TetR/AcrR family transcriptional regulator [Streptomyces sp. NPDC058440]|uniref:TetR/AcrR family transcriptional regulator n=1 Tax=Streptomyces sp. NPDC058440 TaxID=3346501 RepID=UPI00365ABEE0
MRRLGGTRRALDEALRAAGVDPGGQKPVRDRAIDTAAALIGRQGLAAVTFERVAASAQCSVHSLYAAFGGRDELLHAVFERHSPILDVEAALAAPHKSLEDTVRRVYRLLAEALEREPRVLPAMLAQALARPHDRNVQTVVRYSLPRLLAGIGQWLTGEIAAGRVRDMPPLLLIQQMSSPILFHFVLRPALGQVPEADLPTTEEAVETFTRNFLRAVALPASAGG